MTRSENFYHQLAKRVVLLDEGGRNQELQRWLEKLPRLDGKIIYPNRRKGDYPGANKFYETGMSCADVGKIYGVTESAIWQWMKANGIKRRPKWKIGVKSPMFRGGSRMSDAAKRITERAIRKGILIRPPVCGQCGKGGKFKDGRTSIQAHHADYNKPLDVMWLCQLCHHNWHKKFKAIESVIPNGIKVERPDSKLSFADVRNIRKTYSKGIDGGAYKLSEIYGISTNSIYSVIKRKTWKYV